MNFHWPFLGKRTEPAPPVDDLHRALNGQFIPTRKERERRANEASVQMQLGLMKAVTPPEQFAAAVDRASTLPLTEKQKGGR